MNYLYDGSFEGFLTCVYAHYYRKRANGIFAKAPSEARAFGAPDEARTTAAYQLDLLIDAQTVRTDEEEARKVAGAIERRISRYDLPRVYRVFRSSTERKEMLLLNYIRLGFKMGAGVALLHTHPAVLPVLRAEKRICDEAHRLCGLVRFAAVRTEDRTNHNSVSAPNAPAVRAPDILYARVEPDHEVLEFLAPHFTDRFKQDPFIIHDTKRRRALFALKKQWYIADFTEDDAALLTRTETEAVFRGLWQRYFDAIAIKERTNPRCQRNLMPQRYWTNLPEMSRP
jgi:probable DNA metabolism protein